jgi:capsular polysaccharide export protein
MNQEYLKKRLAKIISEKITSSDVNPKDEAVMNLFQNSIAYTKEGKASNLSYIKSLVYSDLTNVEPKDQLSFFDNSLRYIWGIKPTPKKTEKILKNTYDKEDMYIMEDTFIRSIITTSQRMDNSDDLYVCSCGYTIDDLSHYVDATRVSRIEQFINSNWEINDEQKKRSRSLIKKIIDNKITKYNNQPIYKPKIGRVGAKKILVIDQSYNDYSIIKGMANDKTFEYMLNTAIKDNPGADIIIKTHPDAIGDLSLKQKCYYQNIESKDNIYRLTDPINPISLIQYSDKVYVCSSQFGFESLMCGKDTYVFGMPFYAGWGLTKDAQKLERRTKVRTLEEVFYIAYIMFSMYINPKNNKPCEIEEAIDFLIEYRNKYFKEKHNA